MSFKWLRSLVCALSLLLIAITPIRLLGRTGSFTSVLVGLARGSPHGPMKSRSFPREWKRLGMSYIRRMETRSWKATSSTQIPWGSVMTMTRSWRASKRLIVLPLIESKAFCLTIPFGFLSSLCRLVLPQLKRLLIMHLKV